MKAEPTEGGGRRGVGSPGLGKSAEPWGWELSWVWKAALSKEPSGVLGFKILALLFVTLNN